MNIRTAGSATLIGAVLIAFAAIPVTAAPAGWMANGLNIEVTGSSPNPDVPGMMTAADSVRHGSGWMGRELTVLTTLPSLNLTAALVTSAKVPNHGWKSE